MSSFTCIACRVAFVDGDLQRQHYKTDWHRYNLKRKVAELPPVTAEEFQRKVLQRQEANLTEKDSGVYCKICRKSFQSSKAFSNHLNSKKHQESLIESSNGSEKDENITDISCPSTGKVARPRFEQRDSVRSYESDDSEVEEVDSDEWDEELSENNPALHNNCLFCTHHSGSLTKNLKHMSVAHSFFIPDAEYVTDLKGLLLYLGEKICLGYLCLWCNDRGRTFYSMEAAKSHMVDKGHCKMLHEGEALLEYADYYDYRSSYPDYQTHDNNDDDIPLNILQQTEYQLVLPSGAVIGHRSLMRYYRQNLNPNSAVRPMERKINRVIMQYKSLGWKETDKQVVARKARDLNFMKRVQNKHYLQVAVKANKLQPHFRHQVNF